MYCLSFTSPPSKKKAEEGKKKQSYAGEHITNDYYLIQNSVRGCIVWCHSSKQVGERFHMIIPKNRNIRSNPITNNQIKIARSRYQVLSSIHFMRIVPRANNTHCKVASILHCNAAALPMYQLLIYIVPQFNTTHCTSKFTSLQYHNVVVSAEMEIPPQLTAPQMQWSMNTALVIARQSMVYSQIISLIK